MDKEQVFGSVWDALEDTREQAAHLKFRSKLMMQVQQEIKRQGLNQRDAVRRAGVTQPRMSDLMRGRIDKFSIDALVKILDALGREVEPRLVEDKEAEVA